jgi:ABC-type glutathione transport system ATPase component
MLTVENLNKKYVSHGSVTSALVDINLRIEEGEFVCLLGPSGCGKSTLLKIIAGLIPATVGPDHDQRPAGERTRSGTRGRIPGLCAVSLDDRAGQSRIRARGAKASGRRTA